MDMHELRESQRPLTERLSRNVDVTDIVRRAKAEGYRDGVVVAAGIVKAKAESIDWVPSMGQGGYIQRAALFGVEKDILAAIPTADTAPPPEVEVCEWGIERDPEFFITGCGYVVHYKNKAGSCQYCHNPIAVKG